MSKNEAQGHAPRRPLTSHICGELTFTYVRMVVSKVPLFETDTGGLVTAAGEPVELPAVTELAGTKAGTRDHLGDTFCTAYDELWGTKVKKKTTQEATDAATPGDPG